MWCELYLGTRNKYQRRRNVFKIGGADFVKLLATIFIANHVEGGA